jgi:4-hydroxy-tetrahydrodipicolinate reductase
VITQSLQHNPLTKTAPARSGKSERRIKVAHLGLGVIGMESAKAMAAKPWADIVGGIDLDPAKVGKSMEEVTGIVSLTDVPVYRTFEELMTHVQPDVVIHAATSSAAKSFDQMEPMIRAGVSVVSSCEQLLYPYLREPDRSKEINSLCIKHGSGVVGTGVNPGFVMDLLPVCLTGVCRSVQSIHAEREVNASTRRMQLQKKIGSGMDPEEFRRLFRDGLAGHAGFQESAALICHCMGWDNPEITETCEPVVADHHIKTEFFTVKPGETCGLHQVCTAHIDGDLRLTMDLKMFLDSKNPHDAVRITGTPNLNLLLEGGVAGDIATVAAMVNAVPRVLKAGPGLHLMTDLSVPCAS